MEAVARFSIIIITNLNVQTKEFVAIAGERQPYNPPTAAEVKNTIYGTFGILFIIIIAVSAVITMLICQKPPKTNDEDNTENVSF